MVTASDLAYMRAVQSASLPDTCVLQRPSAEADGAGGQTITWASVSTALPCRISTETVVGAGVDGVTREIKRTRMTFARGADVRHGDRIVANGKTYEINGATVHSYQTAERVDVIEVS